MGKIYRLRDKRLEILNGGRSRYGMRSDWVDVFVTDNLGKITKSTRVACLHSITESIEVGTFVFCDRFNPEGTTKRVALSVSYQGLGTVLVNTDTKLVEEAVPPEWMGLTKATAVKATLKKEVERVKKAEKDGRAATTRQVAQYKQRCEKDIQSAQDSLKKMSASRARELEVLRAFKE